MACNVYLSFFRQYDAGQLRGLEWKYLVLCYGLPFVPALAFLFIQSGSSGKVYGDAVVRLDMRMSATSLTAQLTDHFDSSGAGSLPNGACSGSPLSMDPSGL